MGPDPGPVSPFDLGTLGVQTHPPSFCTLRLKHQRRPLCVSLSLAQLRVSHRLHPVPASPATVDAAGTTVGPNANVQSPPSSPFAREKDETLAVDVSRHRYQPPESSFDQLGPLRRRRPLLPPGQPPQAAATSPVPLLCSMRLHASICNCEPPSQENVAGDHINSVAINYACRRSPSTTIAPPMPSRAAVTGTTNLRRPTTE